MTFGRIEAREMAHRVGQMVADRVAVVGIEMPLRVERESGDIVVTVWSPIHPVSVTCDQVTGTFTVYVTKFIPGDRWQPEDVDVVEMMKTNSAIEAAIKMTEEIVRFHIEKEMQTRADMEYAEEWRKGVTR